MKNAAAISNRHAATTPSETGSAARRHLVSAPRSPDNLADDRRTPGHTYDALHAIPSGEGDAMTVDGSGAARGEPPQNDERAFRLLIESMNEGAVTMTTDGTIAFASERFGRMVKCPLKQVVNGSVFRFFPATDQAVLASLLRRKARTNPELVVSLVAADGSRVPARIWIRPLPAHGRDHASVGMVITDISDANADEEMLRSLTHRMVQAHEVERGHVALELHQRITQMLCGILFRCQKLAGQLPAHQAAARAEALKISEMLGETAEEVERISRSLRPSVLDNLGLIAALGATHAEFVARTGMSLKVSLTPLTVPLSAEADIALYRIHQEALKNVEQHAGARHVTVELTQHHDSVRLTIKDDGGGFLPEIPAAGLGKCRGMGIFSMRERAAAVGGVLKVESTRHKGTLIQAQIPSMNRITPDHS